MRTGFAKALRKARKAQGLTQEDFSSVSSRTYLSSLERGQKSPTLDKIDALSQTLGIHFLSLLTLTCMYSGKMEDVESLLDTIRSEVNSVGGPEPQQRVTHRESIEEYEA